MFFIIFYNFLIIFFNKFSNYFYLNNFVSKLHLYIKKVIKIFFFKILSFNIISLFIVKIFSWICIGLILVYIQFKFFSFFFSFSSFLTTFTIKYQLFVFVEYKYDPYSLLKILDFLVFYPVFYIYFYFFNDLLFSFQKIYYWFVYKINNFGISQNTRDKFMHYWSYGQRFQAEDVYHNNAYRGMTNLFKKFWKVSTEHFPFIPNFQYYLFFLFVLFLLFAFVYKVYFKDLKPIKYDADDSIRFDFFRSISDQSFKMEINDYTLEKIENLTYKVTKHPLDFIKKNNQDHFIDEKNSFDLIMNKFGIDGISYLDEIRAADKKPNNYNSFSYLVFFIHLIFDFLETLSVFFKYQIKYNYFSNFSNFNLYVLDIKKPKKLKFKSKISLIFYYIFMIYFFVCYVYLFIIILVSLFILIDVDFLFLNLNAYVIPYGIDLKIYLLFFT